MLGSPAVGERQSRDEIRSRCAADFFPFHSVIPAQARIQGGSAESLVLVALDSRIRGNDVVVGWRQGANSPDRACFTPPSLASIRRYRS